MVLVWARPWWLGGGESFFREKQEIHRKAAETFVLTL